MTTFAYDNEDKLTSVTTPDPDGAGVGVTASVTTYTYDIYERLANITDALSGVTTFSYDKAGQLLTLDDPENNTTTWAYDNLGRVTMETNELADTRSFYHDAAGNLTRKVDRNERVTQYIYDDLNRMTDEKWITNGTPVPTISISTTTEGGAANEVQRVGFTTASAFTGGTFTLTFGGQSTGGIAYNASAATVQSALEALSNIGVGDVSVEKLQNTQTAQEWRITFTGALAGADQSQTTVDSTGVFVMGGGKTNIQATDQNGQAATTDEVQVVTLNNATDGTFRLAFLGQTTAPIAYNASASSVESAVESLQSIDDVTVTGSAGGPWTITFAGTHADTNVQQIQGDAATTQSGTVSRTLSFEYDLANQLTEASDPAATYTYTLDNLGRVTSETQDLANFTPNIVLASTWDANNNRLTLAATLGSNADFKNTYTYDYLNRMTRVVQEDQSGGNVVADKRVDLAYNGLGQFTTIDRYQNTGGTNIVAQSTFAYDDDSRLTDLDHKQSTTTLAGYDYAYDNMGRITSITSTVEGLSSFTYDKTSQLTGADHASPRTDESYTYDDNGNRTMSGYTVTTNNLTTSDGTYDYEYDEEGNRTKRTEISSGNYEVYEWDHRNRLVSVTFYDSLDTEIKSVDHTYDIFNRWIRRTTDPDGPGGSAATDTFFAGYDGIHSVLQFDGSADTDLTNRYLFGPAVDQILASEDVTSLTSAGNILWALSDHLGTPRDIADQNESTFTTTVTNHRTYDSFGKRTAETNSAVDLIFGETGKAFDEDTALGNHLGRWLDSLSGQWLSQDPSAFHAGDVNLRRDVGNTPTMSIDPNGFAAQPPFALAAPVLNGGASLYQASYLAHMALFYSANPPSGNAAHANWFANNWWLLPGMYFAPPVALAGLIVGIDNDDMMTMAMHPIASLQGGIVGVGQGGLNVINGVQDAGIGLLNLPALMLNTQMSMVSWLLTGNYSNGQLIPYIPSPDWSDGVLVPDDPWHDVGKFLGGQSAFLLMTMGWGLLSRPSQVTHMTSRMAADSINGSQVIRGNYGVFGATRLWRSEWLNRMAALIPNAAGKVQITGPAARLFTGAPVTGPISGFTRLMSGAAYAPYSSINLATGATTPLRFMSQWQYVFDAGLWLGLQAGAQSNNGSLQLPGVQPPGT